MFYDWEIISQYKGGMLPLDTRVILDYYSTRDYVSVHIFIHRLVLIEESYMQTRSDIYECTHTYLVIKYNYIL